MFGLVADTMSRAGPRLALAPVEFYSEISAKEEYVWGGENPMFECNACRPKVFSAKKYPTLRVKLSGFCAQYFVK